MCFQVLLEQVVTKTEGYEVYKLEKLYALLCQSIYRHRRDYNKTALIQVITGGALVNFAPGDILSWCNITLMMGLCMIMSILSQLNFVDQFCFVFYFQRCLLLL